uniref:KH-like RNA-binding domain-containing protein n=1 Tax=Aotus nancymaae TaxID=37293 RepID=A0A2K5ET13_AOTNA
MKKKKKVAYLELVLSVCSCALVSRRAGCSVDTPRRFPTLVQLMQPKAMSKVLGQLPKPFSWFHSEFLKNPKVVRLEVWLVEKIFNRGGERIPHVQGLSQILIHVNHPDPNGEAEILIFGRPAYQDRIKMIVNLLQAKGSGKAVAQDVAPQKAETQRSSIEFREAGTQRSVEVREGSPVEVREAGTQQSLEATSESGTLRSPEAASKAGTQRFYEDARDPVTRL